MRRGFGLSRRAEEIPPFLAMDVLARARRLEEQGRSIIHLEVGDPDFPSPPDVVEAGRRALAEGRTHYTEALGIPRLREAIARRYFTLHGVEVSPERIVVGSGSSPLLTMLALAILDPGDEVLVPDPGYSCYPNYVRAAGGVPVQVDAGEAFGYRLSVEALERAVTNRTKALIVNSPANPTGVVYHPDELRQLTAWAAEKGLWLISDEIYHGLSDRPVEPTALRFDPHAIVVDGFSKRFAMTGWRLGWCVVPEELAWPLMKLQQNLMVCAPAAAQEAGIVALEQGEGHTRAMAEELRRRRRTLLAGLERLGWPVAGRPEGAFYVLADVRSVATDSRRFAVQLLDHAGVALTPGIDFGPRAEGHLRFSYAAPVAAIEEAIDRIHGFLQGAQAAAGGAGETAGRTRVAPK
ncbi:MAG: pyridoxal phosphate-dependent aminotransferase [Limnochordaceae bacterium]|nr:pyridoxal phosphate-dependent aminotransferase [Limnochordaceae bacterium]